MTFTPQAATVRKETIVDTLISFLIRDMSPKNKNDEVIVKILRHEYSVSEQTREKKAIEKFGYNTITNAYCQNYVDEVYSIMNDRADLLPSDRAYEERKWMQAWWETRNQFATKLYMFLTETLPNL